MTFIWPFALIALVFVPVLALGYHFWRKRRTTKVEAMLGSGYDDLAPRTWTRHLSPLLALLALTAITVGFARPQATVDVPRFRSTVVLVFDTSESMSADDLEPTRLEVAKAGAIEFVQDQPDSVDIGVVSFGPTGAVTLRPSEQRDEIVAAINRLQPVGATDLEEGVFSALSVIANEPILYLPDEEGNVEIPPVDFGGFGSAIIVLFSDGEDTTESDPLPLADFGAQAGIRIYTVGVGTVEGTTLDIDGFSVASALNEESLQDLAAQTNGTYFLAEQGEDLAAATEAIERDLVIEEERIEISGLFAIAGVVLIALAALAAMLTERRLP